MAINITKRTKRVITGSFWKTITVLYCEVVLSKELNLIKVLNLIFLTKIIHGEGVKSLNYAQKCHVKLSIKSTAYQFPNQDLPYHLRTHGTWPSSALLCLQGHTSVDYYVKHNGKQ